MIPFVKTINKYFLTILQRNEKFLNYEVEKIMIIYKRILICQ